MQRGNPEWACANGLRGRSRPQISECGTRGRTNAWEDFGTGVAPSCLSLFPWHLLGLRPECSKLGWLWVLQGGGIGILSWDPGLRLSLVWVSDLESDGLEVNLGSRLETGKGSELSLGVERGIGGGLGV